MERDPARHPHRRQADGDNYQELYGNLVFDIEYDAGIFSDACDAGVGEEISIVLRDQNVTPGGPFETC